MGLGKFAHRGEAIDSGDDMTLDLKEAAEGIDIEAGWRICIATRRLSCKFKLNLKPINQTWTTTYPPRTRPSIVLDLFKNPNLPLSVTLARTSPAITSLSTYETTTDDDDDDVKDPIVSRAAPRWHHPHEMSRERPFDRIFSRVSSSASQQREMANCWESPPRMQ